MRRLIGNALRRIRRLADHIQARIDPGYSLEIVARVAAQLATERAAYVSTAPVAEPTPVALPEGPLACATCMGVLTGVVAVTGSALHGHRAHALRFVGYGPTVQTTEGLSCPVHTNRTEIQ